MLLLDFEKAFDSISFLCIKRTLSFFGFGPDIIKWVDVLLNNFRASLNHAGNLSDFFDILRGCRQGDPIASLLFILVVELLAIKLRNSTDIKGYKIDNIIALLSLYADDATIFLEYDANTLRATVAILENFFKLSGLKIQLEKSQVIVFGNLPDGDYRLCPEIPLEWKQDFKLLGIMFDPFLEKMNQNFDLKIDSIKETICSWKYRILTPLGRSVIAKTLLLSKLSYVAIVLPSLGKRKIKNIEDLIYDFIWKGKDKTARPAAKVSEAKGGLNMPDIMISWDSFKLSWIRRLYYNKEATWAKILEVNLKEINPMFSLEFLFEKMGISSIEKTSKSITNSFWKECITKISPFSLELVKKTPEVLLNCPIWGSKLFLRHNSILAERNFSSLYNMITYPNDVLSTDQSGFLHFIDEETLRQQAINLVSNEYTELKHILTVSLRKYGIVVGRSIIDLVRPVRPISIILSNLTDTGCSGWTKLMKDKPGVLQKIIKRESAWEVKLNARQGPDFWNRCYGKTREINFDNKIKWFQYQIYKGTLKTNNIVSHFKPLVNKECTFCNTGTEDILHLFWECTISKQFIDNTISHINLVWPDNVTNPSKMEFIFGIKLEKMSSPRNYLNLYIKRFIWIKRCAESLPTLAQFLNWFRSELSIASQCTFKFKTLKFLENPAYRGI